MVKVVCHVPSGSGSIDQRTVVTPWANAAKSITGWSPMHSAPLSVTIVPGGPDVGLTDIELIPVPVDVVTCAWAAVPQHIQMAANAMTPKVCIRRPRIEQHSQSGVLFATPSSGR